MLESELIHGEYYFVSAGGESLYIFQYNEIPIQFSIGNSYKGSDYITISKINPNNYARTGSFMASENKSMHEHSYRLATDTEKQCLIQSREAGKYVPINQLKFNTYEIY